MTETKLVHVDSSGRTSLGGWVKPNQLYQVTMDDYGRIYLDLVPRYGSVPRSSPASITGLTLRPELDSDA